MRPGARSGAEPRRVTTPTQRDAAPPAPALAVEGLAFAYPDGHQALFGVSLAVARGERVAVLGPNGSGKTTLVLHLNGTLGAVAGGTGSGRIAVGGLSLTRAALPEIRRRVGLVFQDPDDQLFMPTVGRDVAFGPRNLGLGADETERRVREALDAVGLSGFEDRVPHHLSFGEKRRAALAGVLATDPEVLVLDEPSSNLDPAARRDLAAIIRSLGLATVMVTHDLPYAAELCSRAVILDAGRVVADGPIHELLRDSELLAEHRLELPYGFSV